MTDLAIGAEIFVPEMGYGRVIAIEAYGGVRVNVPAYAPEVIVDRDFVHFCGYKMGDLVRLKSQTVEILGKRVEMRDALNPLGRVVGIKRDQGGVLVEHPASEEGPTFFTGGTFGWGFQEIELVPPLLPAPSVWDRLMNEDQL